MLLIENEFNIPLDVLRYLNEFMYEELNDTNFKNAVK